jgi:hypothetical protein
MNVFLPEQVSDWPRAGLAMIMPLFTFVAQIFAIASGYISARSRRRAESGLFSTDAGISGYQSI